MPSITSLTTKLRTDFPQYTFTPDAMFRWSPDDQTVFYDDTSGNQAALLHELSHALLGHKKYTKDIQLLEMERDAWERARGLGPTYGVAIDEAAIQDSLDTYRDWLHARSTCPNCQATGIQSKKSLYSCIACGTSWRVNEARICALRRYTTTK